MVAYLLFYSLAATINKNRTGLVSMSQSFKGSVPIPDTIPSTLLHKEAKDAHHIADVGQPITACFLTKSHTNPTDWYIIAIFFSN